MYETENPEQSESVGKRAISRRWATGRVRRAGAAALTVCAIAAAIVALSVNSATAQTDTVRVADGESIQAAIDSADEGSTVIVEAGVYEEQVRIKTNGITLQGEPGAIIRPGAAQSTNDCSWLGLGSAICVGTEFIPETNPDWPQDPFPEGTIKNVVVAGLTIEGPTGFGIRVVDGKNIDISDNAVSGVLAPAINVGSVRNYTITGNSIDNDGTDNFTPLMFVGRSTNGSVKNNEIRNSAQNALTFGRTRKLTFAGNDISGSCGGVYIEQASRKLKLTRNVISANNTLCQFQGIDGDIGGYGILLIDGSKIVIRANTIADNVADGPSLTPGGVIVTAAPGVETGPKNVTIVNNTITGNVANGVALDVFAVGVPKLRVLRNTCEVSLPDASWCVGIDG